MIGNVGVQEDMNNMSRSRANVVINESTTLRDKLDEKNGITNTCVVTKLFAQQNLHDVPCEILNQVPSNDRENSLYEVHGVLKPVEESPELIQEKMSQLSSYLSDQQRNNSTVANSTNDTSHSFHDIYQKIQHESPEFTERCLLSCLRADGFDVENAAARFILHIQAKVRLFGFDSVGKNLGLRDLVGSARRVMDDGTTQLLRKRDRSGRPLVVHFNSTGRNHPMDPMLKVLLCLVTILMQDEEVQKRGFVYIMCSFDDKPPPIERVPALLCLLSSLPIRISAFHFCTHDVSRRQQLTDAVRLFDTSLLCRFNSHFGTCVELRHNLMTFGIPLDALPFRDDASVDLKSHREWVTEMEQLEEQRIAGGTLHHPSDISFPILEDAEPHDVVFGRGTRWTKHSGNIRLKRLLEEHRSDFDTARRKQQTAITKVVYATIRREGSRFLLFTPPTTFTEVSERHALDRISQWFRNLRLLSKKVEAEMSSHSADGGTI